MSRRRVASRGLVVTLVLAWAGVAAVLAAWPVLTTSSGERPQSPAAAATPVAPAPSAVGVVRLRPRLDVRARATAFDAGRLRLRIGTTGTFRPTAGTPARLRVLLHRTGHPTSAQPDRAVRRVVRRVTLTGAALSPVFRHLAPGTWRWEVDAVPGWARAVVTPDSGRVLIGAPHPEGESSPGSPPQPPPAPEQAPATTVEAAAPGPDTPAYQPQPAGGSTAAGDAARPSPDPARTAHSGPSHQPATPFGGGGAPTPEGPHAP